MEFLRQLQVAKIVVYQWRFILLIILISSFCEGIPDCQDVICPQVQQIECPADSHQQFISNGSESKGFSRKLTDNSTLNYNCCSHWECKCKTDYCTIPQCNNSMLISIPNNDKQLKQPGNCCLLYKCIKRDYCISPITNIQYANHTIWIEEDCTECQCINGRTQCHTSFCKSLSCLKTIQLPDKCCPVCDPNETQFCSGFEDCDIVCQNGYHKLINQTHICHLCQCQKPLQIHKTNCKKLIHIYCLILMILLLFVVILLGILKCL